MELIIKGKQVANDTNNSLKNYIKEKYNIDIKEEQQLDFWLWLEDIGEYGDDEEMLEWSDKKCLEYWLKYKLKN